MQVQLGNQLFPCGKFNCCTSVYCRQYCYYCSNCHSTKLFRILHSSVTAKPGTWSSNNSLPIEYAQREDSGNNTRTAIVTVLTFAARIRPNSQSQMYSRGTENSTMLTAESWNEERQPVCLRQTASSLYCISISQPVLMIIIIIIKLNSMVAMSMVVCLFCRCQDFTLFRMFL